MCYCVIEQACFEGTVFALLGVSVFAWLLNSVLGEGLVKHAPNVISKKKKVFHVILSGFKVKKGL